MRKRKDESEPAEGAATETEKGMTRFPVTPSVAAELEKYGKARRLSQGKVAEELEADLLALFRGELSRDLGEGGVALPHPIPSLKERAAKAIAEEW